MYYTCDNCKKDLLSGDMCRDCALFLRPETVVVPAPTTPEKPVEVAPVAEVAKVVKAKKVTKKK